MRFNSFSYFLFVFISLVGSLFLDRNYVKADFGEADVKNSFSTTKNFDAWCGKKGNDCKVTFLDEGISVNGSKPVDYGRIKDYNYDENHGWGCEERHAKGGYICPGKKYTFEIYYDKNSGEEGTARFIFANHNAALGFLGALKKVQGEYFVRSDPRCKVKDNVFYDGACMTKGQARNLKLKQQKREMQGVVDALEDQRQYDLKERELDIKSREADAKIFDAYNNQNNTKMENNQNTNIFFLD